ncbi:MAG: hypothetical protein WC879_00935 [Melioribacteraceae bacterium]
MNLFRKHSIIYRVLIFMFFIALIESCNINMEPTAPNWDVSLNVPIANKSYTMFDILENKSSSIQHYTDVTNGNLLYYTNIQQMDKIILSSKLKSDLPGVNGAISINSDSVTSDIDFSWISPPVSPGMRVVLPAVPETNVTGNFSLADQFESIKIESGFIDIEITNFFPLPMKITLRNLVLKNAGSGEIIAQPSAPVEVLPLQTVTVKSIPILPGVRVKNQLSLESKISSTGSNGQQITLPDKSLRIKTKYRNLMVSEYSGQLKPTVLEKTRSTIALNVKDIQKKLQFQQINLKNPKIELRFRSTANVEFSIDGSIEARNTIGQRSVMSLSSRTLDKIIISPVDSVITFNADSVSKFFNRFSQFPDSIVIYTGGTVNPNRKTINLNKNDQVTINSKMEFPLEFGLGGGEFSDSVKVDLSNDDRNQIKDINFLGAALKITNGIPASISFTAKLYDQNKNFLMYFPPKYSDQDTVINVNGAVVDANGNVTSNTIQNVTVKTLKSEIDKITKATFMRVRIRFSTSGSGNQAVKFRTDNVIKFFASGSTNYHINPKGE